MVITVADFFKLIKFKNLEWLCASQGFFYPKYGKTQPDNANQLTLAEFKDESYASYSYDAFGRRVYREEMSWKDLDGIGKGKENGNNGKGDEIYAARSAPPREGDVGTSTREQRIVVYLKMYENVSRKNIF
jgi:hypothetical protein